MKAATRIGSALGAVAAFVLAFAQGGPTAWTAAALTAGILILLATVLFIPNETPARRLRLLIQAWQHPSTEPEPNRPPMTPPAPRQGPS